MTFTPYDHLRADLELIAHWIPNQTHVLDLGCGDGMMLDYLQTEKKCTGYGIEIADAAVLACTQRGVPVIQQNCESGLAMFADNAFDTVLCLSALQMMKNIKTVLRDIARVGKQAIVSLPNFAYWSHRVALATGQMPSSSVLPYAWYESPNTNYATMDAFTKLAKSLDLILLEVVTLNEGRVISFLPKLRGSLMVFRLKNKNH